MTPEQKRDRMLKRVLPALFITVIYFVFVSNFMVEAKDKAEKKYIELAQKGLSQSALDAKQAQTQRLQQQLRDLTQKKATLQSKIQAIAGFMTSTEDSAITAGLVSKILADHQVIVIEETVQTLQVADLSKSIRDIKSWLQPGETITGQKLELRGDFLAMYHALEAIKQQKISVLPIVFSMQSPDDKGGLQWTLSLWM